MAKQEQIIELIEPSITALGCSLWGIELLSQGKYSVLRIYIDKADGVSSDDCQKVSQQVGRELDVAELFRDRYQLEVSSPGLDRRFFNQAQYQAYIGHDIQVKLRRVIQNKRKWVGELLAVSDSAITLATKAGELSLPFADIDRANLDVSF